MSCWGGAAEGGVWVRDRNVGEMRGRVDVKGDSRLADDVMWRVESRGNSRQGSIRGKLPPKRPLLRRRSLHRVARLLRERDCLNKGEGDGIAKISKRLVGQDHVFAEAIAGEPCGARWGGGGVEVRVRSRCEWVQRTCAQKD